MRCVYCNKHVLGLDPITVPGVGAAHHACYQTRLTAERIFNGLNIAKLDNAQFNELSDLVLMEKNMRKPPAEKSEDSFDVELF